MADFPSNDLLSIQTSPILLHSSSDCEDDPPIPQSIHEKLRHAFVNIKVDDLEGLIQFWEPVNIEGRCLLTTSDQPFIIFQDDENFRECRSCCEKYKYNIDVNYNVEVEIEEDPTITSTGAPATAFRNQLPEFPRDLNIHEMRPLASSALQGRMMYSFVVPVFYPSLSSCVGVVEYLCSWSPSDVFEVFNELNTALEKVGFKTFDGRELLPYRTECGLQHAKDEIDDALMIISEALRLDLTQVWIANEDEYHMPFSSSLQTKRMLWLKLTSHCVRLHDEDSEWNKDAADYEEACYRLPMKIDNVFARKTLQNYEPLFIRDSFKWNGDERRRSLSFYLVDCSCFMICLRSTMTGKLDYVFEFLWSEIQHNDNMFELLLFSLKRCLPSFKFASGAELLDKLHILDVQASTESETKYIKIFQTNQLSPVTPKSVSVTPKRGRRPEDEECLTPLKAKCKTAKKEISLEQIELEFGKTQKEAAENLNVSLSTLKRYCKVLGISEWPGKDYSKENVNYSYKNTQSNPNEEEDHNGGAIQDNIRETSLGENILTIKSYYANQGMFIFHLPILSATFESIEKEINERFKLNPSDYKVMYLDEEGDWISLSSDKDMRICIQNLRDLNITKIKMHVLPRQI